MEKIWRIKKNPEIVANDLKEKYNFIILKLLALRGLKKKSEIDQYFNFDYNQNLSDPFLVTDMDKVVLRIIKAQKEEEKIAIFGDYDADGVTASAVLYETFRQLGLENIICYIPDRQTEGYGINKKALAYLAKEKTNLIITVDCGITNYEEIEEAKKLGIDVIITDHHNIPEKIPEAYAVINPNLANTGFAWNNLAGVGVAFKVAQALFQKIIPQKKEQLKWLLDIVAIGTIADCVPLIGENRILAKYGLIVISKTRRTGLLELFKVGRIMISDNKIPSAHQVAFQIAPRINAAGRMDHANIAFDLLTEEDPVLARGMALEVEEKNKNRQKITAEIFKEIQIIAKNFFQEKKFIYASNSHWPVGILGLVAGRITDEFKRPTIVLQEQENEYVGSLRSIPEVNIMKILKDCQDLLQKFGGHSQAAGVTITKKNIEKFYAKMSSLVEKELAEKKIAPILEVDLEISTQEISWDLVMELKKMEPFGIGNQEPIFSTRSLIISECKIVGNGSKHWKLVLKDEQGGSQLFEAIGFSLVNKFPNLKKDDKIDIVFNIQEDEWNGNKKIQLNLIDLKIKTS